MPSGGGQARSAVTATDILQLREIGYPDGAMAGASPLAVSPDGKSVAFVMSRADVASNTYCRALMVLPLVQGGKPVAADTGGDYMSLSYFVRGLWVESGFPQLVTPAWSPHGRAIAVLKREGGVTQAEVVPLEPGGPRLSTHSTVDVENLWWSNDGSKLYFTSRPAVAAVERQLDKEGQSGWLYDSRIAPNYGPRPRIQERDAPIAVSILDMGTGSTRAAAPGETEGPPAQAAATSRQGRRAWLKRDDKSPRAPQRLYLEGTDGHRIPCNAPACEGRLTGPWWSPDGREIWFERQEGWHGEISAFYRWNGTESPPVRTLATLDVVQNCVAAVAGLACTLENSTTPRRIVLVDPHRGSVQTIFDPNPEFSHLRLGRVRRLRFRNDRGLEAWADLVLPPGLAAGARAPLILVQYNSRGFLRGGTGNEYLIYPLAAAGFAVLSLERPPTVASLYPGLTTAVELNAANQKDWAERRSLLSATLTALDLAVKTGRIDPARIGITGLSDGATSARFALLNSNRFAAAAISSCCLEPKTVMTYGGIAWAEFNRAIGYPPATVDDPAFWRPMSMAQNAGRMHTPLLIQASDDEYLLSLEAYEALREKGAPVELYLFPDEHHIKWQPRHKLAAFDRALDWFEFWLDCHEDPDPAKADQYRRWEAMRPHAGRTLALCPALTAIPSTAPMPPRRPGS